MKFYKKKNLGQHFLVDQKIIKLIADVGNINNENSIIEVGPGNGALTKEILKKNPKDFVLIEKDERLIDILNEKFGTTVKIVNDDMLKFAYDKYFKKNLIIFGNLPYNISTQILVKWIKIKNLHKFCEKFILMFQKEVADRIIAEKDSRDYGRLSILSNWKMKIEKVIDIDPVSFSPKPKVKSTLLIFIPKKKFIELQDPKNLEHVTNIFFSQRRKMIKKPMKSLFKNFEEISNRLSIDLNLRPQNLDYLTYYKICKIYEASRN